MKYVKSDWNKVIEAVITIRKVLLNEVFSSKIVTKPRGIGVPQGLVYRPFLYFITFLKNVINIKYS